MTTADGEYADELMDHEYNPEGDDVDYDDAKKISLAMCDDSLVFDTPHRYLDVVHTFRKLSAQTLTSLREMLHLGPGCVDGLCVQRSVLRSLVHNHD